MTNFEDFTLNEKVAVLVVFMIHYAKVSPHHASYDSTVAYIRDVLYTVFQKVCATTRFVVYALVLMERLHHTLRDHQNEGNIASCWLGCAMIADTLLASQPKSTAFWGTIFEPEFTQEILSGVFFHILRILDHNILVTEAEFANVLQKLHKAHNMLQTAMLKKLPYH